MPSNHLILCRPLFLPPSTFPTIRVFSNESGLRIRWIKDWSISFSISSSNEYSGLISFRMDWLDLLAVQGTLQSLLQHHNSKASILVSYMIFYMFQCYSPKSSHPLPLPESIRLFYTSVSLLLSCTQDYCYHLSKFHIYALVYCIGVFLSGTTQRDGMGREVGGGFRLGNTCIPVADSF